MMNAKITEDRAVPLWAALGAPLLGVPLLVALIALVAPAPTVPADAEANQGVEQVEIQPVDQSIGIEIDTGAAPTQRG